MALNIYDLLTYHTSGTQIVIISSLLDSFDRQKKKPMVKTIKVNTYRIIKKKFSVCLKIKSLTILQQRLQTIKWYRRYFEPENPYIILY